MLSARIVEFMDHIDSIPNSQRMYGMVCYEYEPIIRWLKTIPVIHNLFNHPACFGTFWIDDVAQILKEEKPKGVCLINGGCYINTREINISELVILIQSKIN